jgi:polysaccharide transporter, PST family
MSKAHHPKAAVISAGLLAGFQILGLMLSLLSLPILARALGVDAFGQVMLSQFVVLFAVVFVDSGLNVESQRSLVVAKTELERAQILLNNLFARGHLALFSVLVVLLLGLSMRAAPFWMIVLALLHVLGTLTFPQWWFIARGQGLMMGLTSTVGRLISTVSILMWVQSPEDVGIAVLAASTATLISGLMMAPLLWREVRHVWHELDWDAPFPYLKKMKHLILPGFVSSSAQSLPALMLGYFSGSIQVGLFSAADRLTRAAAHVGGVGTQSLLTMATRWHLSKDDELGNHPGAIFKGACVVAVLGLVLMLLLAPLIISMLYGLAFSDSVQIFRLLAIWLVMYWLRGIWVVLAWTAKGNFRAGARMQWVEGGCVAVLSAAGAFSYGATGVALALVAVECVLWVQTFFSVRANRIQKGDPG